MSEVFSGAEKVSGARITVAICTHDRDAHLRRLLEALAGILLPEGCRVRILVVDNNSSGATRSLCETAATRLPVTLDYVKERVPGVVSSRNRAVTETLARGDDFLAFLDDDDVPDSDWLVQLVRVQAATGAGIVAGNRRLADPPPWTKGVEERREKKSGEKTVGSHSLPRSAGTGNVLISRGVLLTLMEGGDVFRQAFTRSGGEDKDFFLRALKVGATMVYAEHSFITQYHDPQRYTARGVLRRGFKCGCSKMSIVRSHGGFAAAAGLVCRAAVKLLISIITLPLAVFTRQRRLEYLYRLGKSLGVFYFLVTGKSATYYDDQ